MVSFCLTTNCNTWSENFIWLKMWKNGHLDFWKPSPAAIIMMIQAAMRKWSTSLSGILGTGPPKSADETNIFSFGRIPIELKWNPNCVVPDNKYFITIKKGLKSVTNKRTENMFRVKLILYWEESFQNEKVHEIMGIRYNNILQNLLRTSYQIPEKVFLMVSLKYYTHWIHSTPEFKIWMTVLPVADQLFFVFCKTDILACFLFFWRQEHM